jgi:hypothetical protein
LTGVNDGCTNRQPLSKYNTFHKHFDSTFSPASEQIVFQSPLMQWFSMPAKLETSNNKKEAKRIKKII